MDKLIAENDKKEKGCDNMTLIIIKFKHQLLFNICVYYLFIDFFTTSSLFNFLDILYLLLL